MFEIEIGLIDLLHFLLSHHLQLGTEVIDLVGVVLSYKLSVTRPYIVQRIIDGKTKDRTIMSFILDSLMSIGANIVCVIPAFM